MGQSEVHVNQGGGQYNPGLIQRSMLIWDLPLLSQQRHRESGDLDPTLLFCTLEQVTNFEPQESHLQMRGSGPDDHFSSCSVFEHIML